MTRSHRCWFITNIWKSDHRLNMSLGTNIKFTLSFLSAKSLCWWKAILSYFKAQKLCSEDNLNANGRLFSDVGSAMLSVSGYHIYRFTNRPTLVDHVPGYHIYRFTNRPALIDHVTGYHIYWFTNRPNEEKTGDKTSLGVSDVIGNHCTSNMKVKPIDCARPHADLFAYVSLCLCDCFFVFTSQCFRALLPARLLSLSPSLSVIMDWFITVLYYS